MSDLLRISVQNAIFWVGFTSQHQVTRGSDEDGRGVLPQRVDEAGDTAAESEVSSDAGCFLSEEAGFGSDEEDVLLEGSSEDDVPHFGKSSFPVEVVRGRRTVVQSNQSGCADIPQAPIWVVFVGVCHGGLPHPDLKREGFC